MKKTEKKEKINRTSATIVYYSNTFHPVHEILDLSVLNFMRIYTKIPHIHKIDKSPAKKMLNVACEEEEVDIGGKVQPFTTLTWHKGKTK